MKKILLSFLVMLAIIANLSMPVLYAAEPEVITEQADIGYPLDNGESTNEPEAAEKEQNGSENAGDSTEEEEQETAEDEQSGLGNTGEVMEEEEQEVTGDELSGLENNQEGMVEEGQEVTEDEQLKLIESYTANLRELEPDEPVGSLEGEEELWVRSQSIPAAYDSRNRNIITSVKDQNPYGNCWAYSTISSAETSVIINGIPTSQDLSERHLAYFTYHSVTDPLGGTGRDRNGFGGSVTASMNYGGNYTRATRSLSMWQGAVMEEDAPGSQMYSALPGTVEAAYGNKAAILRNAYAINSVDQDYVKKMIMQYGSAGIMYCAVSDFNYYNVRKSAQYCDVERPVNHAVSVVGWDDNYGRDNFTTKPAGNGAWLVKNSWGTSFGLSGYFWLSYEDKTINSTFYVFEMQSAGLYQNNYQYDGSAADKFLVTNTDSVKIANLFTIHANQGKKERLDAVSFHIGTVNTNYDIQIYRNPVNSSDPESGTPLLPSPQTGVAATEGYYTVDLAMKPELEQNDRIAIVITLKNNKGTYRIPVEGTLNYPNGPSSEAGAAYGESFYWTGAKWSDILQSGFSGVGNIRIKAFTTNLQTPSIPLISKVEIKGGEILQEIGTTYQLRAEVTAAGGTNTGVSWSSSNEAVARIDQNGKIIAVGIGNAIITATVKADSRIQANLKVSVPDNQNNQVRGFVYRMYDKVLKRPAELTGLNDWSLRLISGRADGASLSTGFILSDEFLNRRLNDSDYIDVLYISFFNRAADRSGKELWLNYIQNGISREYILQGFVNSAEFDNLCRQYGIKRGNIILTAYRDQNPNLTMFVNRLYTKALERTGEATGIEFWTEQIITRKITPENAAKSFVFSEEFTMKKLDDRKYIEVLYRTFMDREYDSIGMETWLKELKKSSRQKVLEGFSRSTEFADIMKSYGL